jgi:hypothetical protein
MVGRSEQDAISSPDKTADDLIISHNIISLYDIRWIRAKVRCMISEELSSSAENLTVRHPRGQFSLLWLMGLTALSAGAFVILRRPDSSALLLAFVIVALVGSLRGRSMGRSGLIGGLLAGVAATVTFQAIEVAYYHTVDANNHSVAQLLNVAAAPLAGAVIGGFVGLTVWFVGSLTGWPAKREG